MMPSSSVGNDVTAVRVCTVGLLFANAVRTHIKDDGLTELIVN